MRTRTSNKWCKCGYHIRGPEHNNGEHHRKWWDSLKKEEREPYKNLAPTN